MVNLSERIVLIVATLAGIIEIVGTRRFRIFDRGLPHVRFWPMLVGISLLILCAVHFMEHWSNAGKNKKPIDLAEVKRSGTFTLFFIVMLLGVGEVIGVLPALAVFMFVSFKIWNELKTSTALMVSLGLTGVVYYCFEVLMRIKFPMGLWG